MSNEFGEWCRDKRTKLGLSLRELERKTGISRTYLSFIEKGTFGPPSRDKVIAMAQALGSNIYEPLSLAGYLEENLERKCLKAQAMLGVKFEDVISDAIAYELELRDQ